MYSDYLDRPSPKDCYLLNDQSPTYESTYAMAEMNETGTQSNFDYILNSFYLPVNQYNTGFELLDDCKNMSFSELFDQELFSSHENKDCQITIKIEKDNSIDPCYSADESQDITDNHILLKTEENFPSPTKSCSLKRGIHRTSIKPTENCDVTHLLYSPFCDTDDFSIEKVSVTTAIANCQPNINNSIKPIVDSKYDDVHDLQSSVVNLDLENSKDSILPSSKISTSNRGINKTLKKTPKNDLQNPFCESMNANLNNIVDENIIPPKIQSNYPKADNQIKINGHNLVKVKENVPSSSLKILPKKRRINETSLNTTENVTESVYNPFSEPENIGSYQKSTKVRVRGQTVIKRKPKDVINTIQQKIVQPGNKSYYSDNNFKNKTDNHNLVKIEDVSKYSTSKQQSNKIISTKTTEKNDVKTFNFFGDPKVHSNDPHLGKAKPHILKRKPMYTNNVQQNIFHNKIKPLSSDESKKTSNFQNSVKIKESLKSSTPKHKSNNKTSTKKTEKNVKNLSCDLLNGTKVNSIDKISVKVEPCFKEEPLYINYNIEQNIDEIEVESFSPEDLQSLVNYTNSVKLEETLKTSTPKRKSNNKTSTKKTEKNVKNLSCDLLNETKVNSIDKISVKVEPCIKEEPLYINYNIEQDVDEIEVESFSPKDLQNAVNYTNSVKIEQTLKTSTPKRKSNNKTSTKTTEKNVKNFSCNLLSESKTHDNDQISVKVEPCIKEEPLYINYNIEQDVDEIEVESFSPKDLQNTVNYTNSVKIKETSKLFSSKHKSNNKTSTKTTEKNVKNLSCNLLSETKANGYDQVSVKVEPYIKEEPLYINYNIEQDVDEIEVESFSPKDLQNTVNYTNSVEIEETSKLFSPKHRNNNKTSTKTTEKNVKNLSCNLLNETKANGYDQISVKVEPYIKEEPLYINYNIEQNIDEIEVESFSTEDVQNTANYTNLVKNSPLNDTNNHHIFVKVEPHIREELMYINNNDQKVGEIVEYNQINVKETKYGSSNNICYVNSNNTNIKTQKITLVKKENIVPDMNILKYDENNSQARAIKNDINLETEKKKISWEEYRAKRGKIGLMNTSENDETFSVTYDNKIEAIIKEFDRNTAEHFIGQKRKHENKEEQSANIAKDISSEEDEELQKKRMKIEYIKKLLPSSFASEIAKTSSLMRGSSQENIEDKSTFSNSNMFNDKNQRKYTHDNFKKDDKIFKKGHQIRVHSSHRISSSRADYCNKSNRASNSDDYYNRNRIDSPHQGGHLYGQNIRNNSLRLQEQKKVVYVGQIPIKFGKRYLYNRFKEFGTILTLSLHRKPDFRVYYAFVTYTERSEADRAINHGNDDKTQVQLDIRYGERKQTQTPYYDLDDEWLTDWYTYTSNKKEVVRPKPFSENGEHTFEEELKQFYNLAQMKKLNEIKSSSQVS